MLTDPKKRAHTLLQYQIQERIQKLNILEGMKQFLSEVHQQKIGEVIEIFQHIIMTIICMHEHNCLTLVIILAW